MNAVAEEAVWALIGRCEESPMRPGWCRRHGDRWERFDRCGVVNGAMEIAEAAVQATLEDLHADIRSSALTLGDALDFIAAAAS